VTKQWVVRRHRIDFVGFKQILQLILFAALRLGLFYRLTLSTLHYLLSLREFAGREVEGFVLRIRC